MDLAFSGVMTAACRLVVWSSFGGCMLVASRHVFAACIEVAERALAHTVKLNYCSVRVLATLD